MGGSNPSVDMAKFSVSVLCKRLLGGVTDGKEDEEDDPTRLLLLSGDVWEGSFRFDDEDDVATTLPLVAMGRSTSAPLTNALRYESKECLSS